MITDRPVQLHAGISDLSLQDLHASVFITVMARHTFVHLLQVHVRVASLGKVLYSTVQLRCPITLVLQVNITSPPTLPYPARICKIECDLVWLEIVGLLECKSCILPKFEKPAVMLLDCWIVGLRNMHPRIMQVSKTSYGRTSSLLESMHQTPMQ